MNATPNTVKPIIGLPPSMPLAALINALRLEGFSLRYRREAIAPQSNFGRQSHKEARYG